MNIGKESNQLILEINAYFLNDGRVDTIAFFLTELDVMRVIGQEIVEVIG